MSNDLKTFLEQWLDEIPEKTRRVAGTYSGVIVVLDTLRTNYDLGNQSLFTGGGEGGRIVGQNPKRVRTIAHRYDSGIQFNSIGGRTNPGPMIAAKRLLRRLATLNLDQQSVDVRNEFIDGCLKFCVGKLREVQNQKKFHFTFSPPESLQSAIGRLIGDQKKDADQLSALAQHLVGAKLQLRFGESFTEDKSNLSSYAANDAGKPGDFKLGDYVFHVSISPNSDHVAKCIRNIEDELRPVMIVPADHVDDVHTFARDKQHLGKIAVHSIESFVSQNIEELGRFSASLVKAKVVELLTVYNNRVPIAEPGRPYLLIESPLLPKSDGGEEDETVDDDPE